MRAHCLFSKLSWLTVKNAKSNGRDRRDGLVFPGQCLPARATPNRLFPRVRAHLHPHGGSFLQSNLHDQEPRRPELGSSGGCLCRRGEGGQTLPRSSNAPRRRGPARAHDAPRRPAPRPELRLASLCRRARPHDKGVERRGPDHHRHRLSPRLSRRDPHHDPQRPVHLARSRPQSPAHVRRVPLRHGRLFHLGRQGEGLGVARAHGHQPSICRPFQGPQVFAQGHRAIGR